MPKIPKMRILHVFTICPENHMDEVDFLPANKHKSFLQVDSIALVVCSETYPKYPKSQVCNIFAMSQGPCKG